MLRSINPSLLKVALQIAPHDAGRRSACLILPENVRGTRQQLISSGHIGCTLEPSSTRPDEVVSRSFVFATCSIVECKEAISRGK